MKARLPHPLSGPPAGSRSALSLARAILGFGKRCPLSLGFGVVMTVLSQSLPAAPPPGNTNAEPHELVIPLAIFDFKSPAVKDPFFPLSVRTGVPVAVTNAPRISSASFSLKGLSGPAGRRLALINNRTLAAGEDAEVTTAMGRVKIHCVEVKEDSVIIKVDKLGETIELHLRKGY